MNIRTIFSSFPARMALACLAVLLLSSNAWAESLELSPQSLRRHLKGGISALEKSGQAGAKAWLRVAAPKLTTEQAERLQRLNSLGYMGGSSIVGADRPLIIAPFSAAESIRTIIIELDEQAPGFDLKIFIGDEEEDILFRQEIGAAELARAAKSQGYLELSLNPTLEAGDYLLGLDFISGGGRIGKVIIR